MANEDEFEDSDFGYIQNPKLAAISGFDTLYESAIHAAKSIDELDDRSDHYQRPDYKNWVGDVVQFFIWSNILIEDWLTHIVHFHLIKEERVTSEFVEYMRSENVRFDQLREMIYRSGLIEDDGLNGEIKRNRRIRNKVVHDIEKRVSLDIEEFGTSDLETEVDRAFNLLPKIEEQFLEYAEWRQV